MNSKFQNRILKAIQKGLNEALNFQVLTNDEPEDNFNFNGDEPSSYSIDQEIQNAIDNFSYDKPFSKSILKLAKSSNQPKEIIDLCQALYNLSNKDAEITDYDVEILIKHNKLCVVKSKKELYELIKDFIEKRGNEINLNWIDTSEITDMTGLFKYSNFNGNISNWNVSNVGSMSGMFYGSKFNGNISNWDVSNVKNMAGMFAETKFNNDISKWNVSNVENMAWMFYKSLFSGDISKWNVSNVKYMYGMFAETKFNNDISKWNVSNVRNMRFMFELSEFNGDISNWNVSNVKDVTYMFQNSKFNGDISKWKFHPKCKINKQTFKNCPIPEKNKPKFKN